MTSVEILPSRSTVKSPAHFRNLHYPLMAIIVFAPLLEGGTTHLAMMIIRLFILVALAFGLYHVWESGKLPHVRMAVAVPVVLYLGLALFSAVTSPYRNQGLQWLMILGGYAIALYLFVLCIGAWDQVQKLMTLLAVMGMGEAIWAWIEWWSVGIARPNGTFFNANFLASYEAAIALPAIAALCYAPWRRVSGRWLTKPEYWFPIATIVVLVAMGTILLTASRGAALAFLCGVGLVVTLRWGWKGSAFVSVIAVILLILPTPLRERLVMEHAANPESYARWQMWESAVREMMDYPMGIGLGLYQYSYPQYAFPVEGEIARYGKVAFTPHNEYLQMGVELGIMSLTLFLWGIVKVWREAVQGLRARLRREQRIVIVGALGGAGSILAQAGIDSPLHEPGLVILLILFVAIIISHRRWRGLKSEKTVVVELRNRRAWSLAVTVIWCVLLVQVIRVGWAYLAYEAGSAWSAQRQYARAISHLNWAVSLDPEKALFHQSLGAAHYQIYGGSGDRSNLQAAISELRTAIQLNPLDGHLCAVLGSVYARLLRSHSEADLGMSSDKLRGAALEAYRNAIRLQPYMYSHRYELAKLLESLGERWQARSEYRLVLEIEPNFLPARERLARLYLQAGDRKAAEEQYNDILRRQRQYAMYSYDPNATVFLNVNAATLEAELRSETPKT